MTRPSLALLVALLASACAAPRSTSPSPGSVAKADKKDRPDSSLTCYQEAPTGSHIVKTVCYTPEQLAQMSREAQDFIRQASQSGASSSMPNSPGSSPGAGR